MFSAAERQAERCLTSCSVAGGALSSGGAKPWRARSYGSQFQAWHDRACFAARATRHRLGGSDYIGTMLRLKGKGAPGAGGARGDEYVTLKVMLPDKPDPELEQFLTERAARTRGARQSTEA